jgi:hypothetical protein
MQRLCFIVLCCLAAASAQASTASATLDNLRSYAPCFKGDAVWPCLKERALALFNKVSTIFKIFKSSLNMPKYVTHLYPNWNFKSWLF